MHGIGRGSNVANAVRQNFAREADQVEQGKNKHTVKKVWKKLDNMKYHGKVVRIS